MTDEYPPGGSELPGTTRFFQQLESTPRAHEARARLPLEGERASAGDAPAGSAPQETGAPEGDSAAGERPRRRRGTRGGRRRRRSKETAAQAETATSDADGAERSPEEGAEDPGPAALLESAEADPGADDEADGTAEGTADRAAGPETAGADLDVIEVAPGGAPLKRRSRRGGRRRRRTGAEARSGGQDRSADGSTGGPRSAPDEEGGSDETLGGRRPDASTAEASSSPRRAPRALVPRELDQLPDEAGAEASEAPEAPAAAASAAGAAKKRRRRGSRGGRGRAGERVEGRPAAQAGARLGGRPRTAARPLGAAVDVEAIPGEDDDLPGPVARTAVQEPVEERAGDGRGRRKRRRTPAVAAPEADEDEAGESVPEERRHALILVNAADPEEQRVAVVEDQQIVDFQMTVRGHDSLVNDIYRGRVVNLETAIGAAFIDFGQGRNGFLHTSDVISAYGEKDFSLDKLLSTQIDPQEWDDESGQPPIAAELLDEQAGDEAGEQPAKGRRKRGAKPEQRRRFRARPRLPISGLLRKGQLVVVQVTKDAIGDKGPTLTTYISIPGRYLVLMPSMARTGVSRKIEDEKERRRLKRILEALQVPAGMGVIVRTAGVGRSKAEIKRDLEYLKSAWEAFSRKLVQGQNPAPLYLESDVAIRTMRDLFTSATKAVVVDDHEVHRHLVEFTQKLMPENVDRIQLHTGAKPILHAYGVESDFERMFSRRIELPSGGSIVFDQAEALVAIDVNSGRTRGEGFDFEEIALKANLEAVPEIARQIRLRDLGGIIVIDFIDMLKLSNIRSVERAFKQALDGDRARSKLGRISQFGLLELTRQRLGPGLAKKVFHACPRCRGSGRMRSGSSRAAAILRRLGSALTLKGFTAVEVKAHPEVVEYLREHCSEYLRALEYRSQRELRLFEAPEQVEDSVLRYLRADGREVRPGGRRKR